jgi:hypothetical protein
MPGVDVAGCGQLAVSVPLLTCAFIISPAQFDDFGKRVATDQRLDVFGPFFPT